LDVFRAVLADVLAGRDLGGIGDAGGLDRSVHRQACAVEGDMHEINEILYDPSRAPAARLSEAEPPVRTSSLGE
jgi:hypothetical protein